MRRIHVCFAVTELLGMRPGDARGAATSDAALTLAHEGYDVELLYCGLADALADDWAERYAGAGVRLCWLDRDPSVEPPVVADSYRLLLQLTRSDPDVVVFDDGRGLAFCSVLAKRGGAALRSSRLVNIAHRPSAWLRDESRELAFGVDDVARSTMERTSAELADCVVGPSRDLLRWMLDTGWRVPVERYVIADFGEADAAGRQDAWRQILRPVASDDEPTAHPTTLAEHPSVTVVICHHDQAAHLAAAVRSAVAQDYENLEVLIVDDGSEDPDSLEALEQIESSAWARAVRVLRQDNRYLGAARNAGLRASTSDYVAFCDDDDVLAETYVSSLIEAARRTEADAVTCSLLSVDEFFDGDITEARSGSTWVFLAADLAVGPVYNVFFGAGLLIRRDVALEAGGFHERRGVGFEDWGFGARLALQGRKLFALPQALYLYRMRPGSMVRTTQPYENYRSVFAEYQRFLPKPLASWPALVRGQYDLIDRLEAQLRQASDQIDRLQREVARLETELDTHSRYLAFLMGRSDRVAAVVDD